MAVKFLYIIIGIYGLHESCLCPLRSACLCGLLSSSLVAFCEKIGNYGVLALVHLYELGLVSNKIPYPVFISLRRQPRPFWIPGSSM